MKKIIALLLVLFVCKISFADENGIVTVEERNTKSVNFFNLKSITGTSSYIYDDSGNTGDSYGWIDVSRLNKGKIIITKVETYSSGTLSCRIESQAGSNTVFGEIYTMDFTSSQTIGTVTPISETMKKIRVGWKISSPTGSGSVSTSGYLEGD